MINNKNKKAFTMVEAITVIIIGAFIGLITTVSGAGIAKKLDIMKLKNANLTFKTALGNIIINPSYYSQSVGLSDTKLVVTDYGSFGSNTDDEEKQKKFRYLMQHELGISDSDQIECYSMIGDRNIEKSVCRRSESGIIWRIPDSDFENLNMAKIRNVSGLIANYLPVTVYPDDKHISSQEDFIKYAIVIGVRCDGATITIDSVDCKQKQYSEYNQCKYIDYLANNKNTQEK